MKIYFDGDFWGGRELPKDAIKEVWIEKDFWWNEFHCRIPVIYTCPQGLIIDVCREIPVDVMKAYHQKWIQKDRTNALKLYEFEAMEYENPTSLHACVRALINGELSDAKNMCMVYYVPYGVGDADEYTTDEVALELMDVYHCNLEKIIQFCRILIPWENDGETEIHSLVLDLKPNEMRVPGNEHFITKPECIPFEVEVRHPLKDEVFHIQIISSSLAALDQPYGTWEYPQHYMSLEYICINRPEEHLIIRESNNGDQPRRKMTDEVEGINNGAASATIIGGMDGPTSIFVRDKNNVSTQNASSFLHYEKVDSVEWYVSFEVTKGEKLEVKLI